MRFEKGVSGNPNGRPRGSRDRRTVLRELLNPYAPDLVQKAVDMALQGDSAALKMCLDRLVAPLRTSSPEFPIDATGSLQDRGEAVLQAIQRGQLDAVTGNAYLNALSEQARLKEHTELETRLANLERRNGL